MKARRPGRCMISELEGIGGVGHSEWHATACRD
jgi:hypothetical protein